MLLTNIGMLVKDSILTPSMIANDPSFDELRKGNYVSQFQRSITEHNMAVLRTLNGTEFPTFTINELQAQEVNREATLDGIHFLEGTGVNEALVQVLLNRLC